ncbi:MAG TPA: hypothetical protein VID50_01020 [Candidatus Eisenbacteria bacterium]|jgi:hypothetical protein
MRLLPRRAQRATFLAVLLVLISLPLTWTDRAPWHGIAPTLSRAGGSPDETLNPPPGPPGKPGHASAFLRSGVAATGHRAVVETTVVRGGAAQALRHGDWLLFWRVHLTSLLRF